MELSRYIRFLTTKPTFVLNNSSNILHRSSNLNLVRSISISREQRQQAQFSDSAISANERAFVNYRSTDQSRPNFTPRYRSMNNMEEHGQQTKRSNDLYMENHLYMMDNDSKRFGRINPKHLDTYLDMLANSQQEVTSPVALTLLKCCGTNLPMFPAKKRVEMMQKVWEALEKKGFQFDISHYNSLLSLYLENEHEFLPIDILATLEKKGIEPNRVTFQRLIKRFAQTGDLNGVGTILEHMKSLDLPITDQVVNTLLYANIKAKNESELKSTLEFIQNNGLELSADSYFEMMCGYAENNEFDKVEKIFTEQKEVAFSDGQIFQLLYIFAKQGHVEHTQKILSRLRKMPGFLHEALNAALRVNSVGHSETALDILATVHRSTTQAGETIDFGGALLQQAMDLNFDKDRLIKLCNSMYDRGINKHALESMYFSAAGISNREISTFLMEAMLERRRISRTDELQNHPDNNATSSAKKGLVLRQQCFWPLVLMNARERNLDSLKQLFDTMYANGFPVETLTLSDWMWPHIDEKECDYQQLLERTFSQLGQIPMGKVVTSYFIYKIERQDAEAVSNLLKTHTEHLLVFPFYGVERFAAFVHRTGRVDLAAEYLATRQKYSCTNRDLEFTDHFILHFMSNSSTKLIADLLQSLIDLQVKTSNVLTGRTCDWDLMQHSPMKERLAKLRELSIEFIPEEGGFSAHGRERNDTVIDISTLDEAQLKDYVEKVHFSVINQQIQMCTRNYKVDDLMRLSKILQNLDKSLSPGICVSAMNMFVKKENPDAALQFYDHAFRVRSPENSFVCSSMHLLNLFSLLADKDRIDDLSRCLTVLLDRTFSSAAAPSSHNSLTLASRTAAAANNGAGGNLSAAAVGGSFFNDAESPLGQQQQTFRSETLEYAVDGFMHKLFQPVVEQQNANKSNPADLKIDQRLKIFEGLCKYEPFEVNHNHTNITVEKLIDSNHTDVAFKIFVTLFEQRKKLTKPFRLMLTLASKDDVQMLQKAYDCLVEAMGENRATIKLAIALACAGRSRDASRILSAPNVRFTSDSLAHEGKMMFQARDAKGLESLLLLMKGKHFQAREKLYTDLLTLYRQKRDYKSALNAWTMMQEENFTISKPILDLLTVILTENHQPVPFVQHQQQQQDFKSDDKITKVVRTGSKSTSSLMSKLLKAAQESSVGNKTEASTSSTSPASSNTTIEENLKEMNSSTIAATTSN